MRTHLDVAWQVFLRISSVRPRITHNLKVVRKLKLLELGQDFRMGYTSVSQCRRLIDIILAMQLGSQLLDAVYGTGVQVDFGEKEICCS